MKRYLIRAESFGAIFFDRETGSSDFISEEELEKVVSGKELELAETKLSKKNTDIIIPECLPADHFSAPNAVYLEVTKTCNLRCKHCFNSSGKIVEGQWTEQEILKFVKEMACAGVLSVRFTGGEILTSPYWEKLIKYGTELGLHVSIGSNGTLIDEKTALKLAAAGLKLAVISLDGLEGAHDEIRGAGNFRKTIDGVQYLKKAGVRVRLNMTVMKSNAKDALSLIDLAEKLGSDIVLRRYIPTGNSEGDLGQMLSPKEYKIFNEQVSLLAEKTKVNIFSHYKEDLKKREKRLKPPFYNGKCQAGIVTCALTPGGNVYPCGVLFSAGENLICGNVREDGFINIWNNSEKFKEHRIRIRKMFNKCDTCEKNSTCVGSCTALLYKFRSDPYCERNL